MTILVGLIAAAGLLLAAADEPRDAKPLERYQGTWVLDKPGDGPGPHSLAARANLVKTIAFDGDTVRATAGDQPLLGRLKAGDGWDPMFLLDQNDRDWIRGGCKVDGDRLTIRYSLLPLGEAQAWQGYVDVVYRRDKK